MRNVILKDNDVKQIIAKLYTDGSLRLVERWKKQRCQLEITYLQSDETELLKTNLNIGQIETINCSKCIHRYVCSTEHYYIPENHGTNCKNYKRN